MIQVRHLKSRLGTSHQGRTRNSALEDWNRAENGGGKIFPRNMVTNKITNKNVGSRTIRILNERDDASMSNEENYIFETEYPWSNESASK